MKKTIFALTLSLIFSLTGMAQHPDSPERTAEDKAEKMTERMAEHLALTDDQKVAIYEANVKMISAAREDRKAHFDQYKADLRGILSEEQFEKWKAMHKDKAHSKERAHHRKH